MAAKKPHTGKSTPIRRKKKVDPFAARAAKIARFGYSAKSESGIIRAEKIIAKTKGLKFIHARPELVRRAKAAGALTAPGGIWVDTPKKAGLPRADGTRERMPGVRTVARKNHIIETKGMRRTILIYLDYDERLALVLHADAFVAGWIAAHPRVFATKRAGSKLYVRLVFQRGTSIVERTPDQLEYYLQQKLIEVPDTRTGKARKTARKRKEELAEALIGIRLAWFVTAPKSSKSKKRRKRK